MEEVWVDTEGFPGYQVSNLGNVRSCFVHQEGVHGMVISDPPVWKIRLGNIDRKGRKVFSLQTRNGRSKKRTVHSLVLEAFVGPRPAGLIACHNDGNPLNNRVDNLRWDTHKGNQLDMYKHGTVYCGERHHKSKLCRQQVLEIRERASQGESHRSIAKDFGVTHAHVGYLVRRKLWRHV